MFLVLWPFTCFMSCWISWSFWLFGEGRRCHYCLTSTSKGYRVNICSWPWLTSSCKCVCSLSFISRKFFICVFQICGISERWGSSSILPPHNWALYHCLLFLDIVPQMFSCLVNSHTHTHTHAHTHTYTQARTYPCQFLGYTFFTCLSLFLSLCTVEQQYQSHSGWHGRLNSL